MTVSRPFRTGYSSFPGWNTLGEIKELELERGNEFPDVSRMDPSWPAKWVAKSKLIAYGYVLPAGEWERVTSGMLTREEKKHMEYLVYDIPIEEGDIFLAEDDDEGYLVVRPETGQYHNPETTKVSKTEPGNVSQIRGN